MVRFTLALNVAAALLMLVACAERAGVATVHSLPFVPAAAAGPAGAGPRTVFVASLGSIRGQASVAAIYGSSSTPVILTSGVTLPTALAVDRGGNLFVGDGVGKTGTGGIYLWPGAAASAPVATPGPPLGSGYPSAIIPGPGRLYVSGINGLISIYSGFTTPPTQRLGSACHPYGIAYAEGLNVLYSLCSHSVSAFSTTAFVRVGSMAKLNYANAIYNAGQTLYIGDGTGKVTAYGIGGNPTSAITFNQKKVYDTASSSTVAGIALSVSSGTLYVAVRNLVHPTQSIYAFDVTTGKLKTSAYSGANAVAAIALDSAGYLDVLEAPSLLGGSGKDALVTYAPGATAPMRTVTDGISTPVALAVAP